MKTKQLRDVITKTLLVLTVALLQSVVSGLCHAADEVVYYHNDALGSPVAATDSAGNVLWKEEYEPFGDRLLSESGSKNNALWYTGKEEEGVLGGLQYFGARWYHSDAGRFMGMDPAGVDPSNPMSFNRYAYANNSPYRYVDPTGEIPIDTVWDLGNVAYDIGKITVGWTIGNQAYVVDGSVDLAQDLVALAIPYVPAGASKIVGFFGDAAKGAKNSKRFSDEKQALVDMAKQDKKTGMTPGDMQAYKDLNKGLKDPFPTNKVRGPEVHPNRPHGKEPHGHVGPVDHIPIKGK